MNKKILFNSSCVVLVLLMISCCGSLGDCSRREPLVLKAIGFSQSELDTIVVSKYKKNSGFVNPVSIITTRNHLIQYFYHSNSIDTIFVQVDNDFTSDFDWALKVKASKHELQLGHLKYQTTKEDCQGYGARQSYCYNYLLSVSINGRDTSFYKSAQTYRLLPFFLLKK